MRLPAETNPVTCYVPLTYGDGRRAFGLVVWIAPEASVGMASLPGVLPQWLDVLERREVIWVEPGHAPNPSHSVWRVFAAIEAVRHARERYNIDPDRVYVAGFSGGGRIASHAAVFFPEVFSGAMAFMGCNFFRDVPVPGERNRVWPGFWPNPDMAIVKRAREESRLALVTGANDFNRPSTKATFDECIRDKWAHVTYIEVPGIGHSLPKAEYFEQAVAAVDGPLDEDLDARYAGARELEKKRKPGEACLAYERVARRAQGKPYAADAAARAADIRARLAERVAEIERQISAGRIDRAGPSARRLKLDFAPIADEQADDLIERIRAARSPTSAASSTSPTSQASTRPAPRRSP
jgi:predicted esterase